jgi:hypothetical protein
MRAMKSPGALAASGALEIDQLGSTVVSTPIASLHQLQALLIVFARAQYSFTAHSFDNTRGSSFRRVGHSSTHNRLRAVIPTFRPNSQQPTKERM